MYERISGLAKIGVWECELATGELTWTDTVYDMFEIVRGSAVHRDDTVKLYDAISRSEMERLRDEAIREGTGFTLDVLIHTASGTERWIRLIADIEQEDGKSVRIFGTKQDITAERASQEKMKSLQTELIHLARVSAMDSMSSTLAHELNQPLAAIMNYAAGSERMIERGVRSSELREPLAEIVKGAARAGEIIRRLRKMTRKGEITKERFFPDNVIKEAGALASAAAGADLDLQYDFQDGRPVMGDPIQIQQVLINLIRNACQAVADCSDPHVLIVSQITGDDTLISVEDNGHGLPSDNLPALFDAFVTTKAAGTGIGLSISRTIIEAHGGKIWAENRPEGGARFSFTLPLAEPSSG